MPCRLQLELHCYARVLFRLRSAAATATANKYTELTDGSPDHILSCGGVSRVLWSKLLVQQSIYSGLVLYATMLTGCVCRSLSLKVHCNNRLRWHVMSVVVLRERMASQPSLLPALLIEEGLLV